MGKKSTTTPGALGLSSSPGFSEEDEKLFKNLLTPTANVSPEDVTWGTYAGNDISKRLKEYRQEIIDFTSPRIEEAEQKVDELLAPAEDFAKQLSSGEIPEDVSSQIRRVASESLFKKGIGGQAGRALVARDLGLTSLQLAETGVKMTAQLADLQQRRAAYFQELRQSAEKLLLTGRQLEVGEQESTAARKMAAAELLERHRQFDVGAKASALQMLSDTLSKYHSLAQRYVEFEASGRVKSQASSIANLRQDFDSLVKQLQSLLNLENK